MAKWHIEALYHRKCDEHFNEWQMRIKQRYKFFYKMWAYVLIMEKRLINYEIIYAILAFMNTQCFFFFFSSELNYKREKNILVIIYLAPFKILSIESGILHEYFNRLMVLLLCMLCLCVWNRVWSMKLFL